MSEFSVFIIDHARSVSYVQILTTEEECLDFLKNYITMFGTMNHVDASCDQLSMLVSICLTISKDLLTKKSGVSIIGVTRGKSLGCIKDSSVTTSTERSDEVLDLPSEITFIILKGVILRDLMMMKEVCKYLYRLVDSNIDELVHTTSYDRYSEEYKFDGDNLFTMYERGKSYGPKANKDQKFQMRESSHILIWYKHSCDEENALVMVTVDINLVHTVMYFRPEVLPIQEYTPDYYGWDDNDLGIMVLDREEVLSGFKELHDFLRSERCFEFLLPGYKSTVSCSRDPKDLNDNLLGHQRKIMESLRS